MNEIERLRKFIDGCDETILHALVERAELVQQVKAAKEEAGAPLFDPERKGTLIRRLLEFNSYKDDPAPAKLIEAVFGAIHDASLELMGAAPTKDDPLAVLERTFEVGDLRVGHRLNPFYIAGPCAVETRELLVSVLDSLARLGVTAVRGGAYKPRTSPRSFQGLGAKGLEMLREEATSRGLVVVSEVLDQESLEAARDLVDIVQVGTRNMSNFSLLRRIGGMGRPVLLKRGYGATLDEWLQAAAYLVDGGSTQVIFCERGIRTFEHSTRNTLDLSTVALLKELHGLPVVVDVSHAAGRRDILAQLACAAFATGADGVMVEVHADPSVALSDAHQQITPKAFAELARQVCQDVRRAPSIREVAL